MSKVLLQEINPHGTARATVESDGQTVFFYLDFPTQPDERKRMTSCWVRNLRAAPSLLQKFKMRAGGPPMLPAAQCNHPRGLPEPSSESLSVVWFEEGDAAALLENDAVLAVIPAWSGQNGFYGYARDCTDLSPLCWPLLPDNVMYARIQRSKDYWRWWEGDGWPAYRDSQIEAIEDALGAKHTKYFMLNKDNWPSKAMLYFDLSDKKLLITLLVSPRAQPNVEAFTETPEAWRRIEMAAAFDPICPENEVMRFADYLSGQTEYPWARFTWLGNGHTLPCDSVPPSLGGANFPYVLMSTRTDIPLPHFLGDPVNLLWLTPITAAEQNDAAVHGSTPLLAKLEQNGYTLFHRDRSSLCAP